MKLINMIHSEILTAFLDAQNLTTEYITLEFKQFNKVEFWHFTDVDSQIESFCILSDDITLEEFKKQMVEYLKTII